MLERSSNTPFRERSGPAEREGRGKDAVTDIDLRKPPTSRLPCLRVPRPWRGHPLNCPIPPFFLGLVPAGPPFVVAEWHPLPIAPGSLAASGRCLSGLWFAGDVTAGDVVRAGGGRGGWRGPAAAWCAPRARGWLVAAAGGPQRCAVCGWSSRVAQTRGAPRARGWLGVWAGGRAWRGAKMMVACRCRD